MKFILIAFILFFTNNAFSQRNVFDTLKIDSSTKIIGRYPQYDESRTYEKFNFIIEDSAAILKFVKSINLGEEVPNSIESASFKINVIKNYKEKGGWTINPTMKSALTQDGHTYKFDLNQLTSLNKEYPFDYYCDKVTFKSPVEYRTFLEKQKKNPLFLFDYAPQFKYEGSFEIEFQKSKNFSSPKTISDYLEPLIEEIVGKGEYSVSYILSEKNLKNHNKSYTMTIDGSRKLFDELKIDKHKNENWVPIIEEAWFFYRK